MNKVKKKWKWELYNAKNIYVLQKRNTLTYTHTHTHYYIISDVKLKFTHSTSQFNSYLYKLYEIYMYYNQQNYYQKIRHIKWSRKQKKIDLKIGTDQSMEFSGF